MAAAAGPGRWSGAPRPVSAGARSRWSGVRAHVQLQHRAHVDLQRLPARTPLSLPARGRSRHPLRIRSRISAPRCTAISAPSPARGVTCFQIFAVASTNSGNNWEFVSSSQSQLRSTREKMTGYLYHDPFDGHQGGSCSAFTNSTASPSIAMRIVEDTAGSRGRPGRAGDAPALDPRRLPEGTPASRRAWIACRTRTSGDSAPPSSSSRRQAVRRRAGPARAQSRSQRSTWRPLVMP